jgi:pimeloyl-ACP methyl ester carboxylesterase
VALDLNHVRRGSGDPVLLVPSLGGSIVMWEPVLDRIAAEREVIAVDIPGFGGSPSLPDSVRPTAANLAAAILEFYDELGIGAAPVVSGISLGGWVAIECGRQGGAAGVVGICTAGYWPEPLGPKRSVARLAAKLVVPFVDRLVRKPEGRRRALASQMRHTERMTPEQAATIIRGYAQAPAYDAANDEMRSSVVGDLSDVGVPLTLAWAEYDTLVRRSPLPSAPPSTRQVVLPDAGHIPTWDQPEMVAGLILEAARVQAAA